MSKLPARPPYQDGDDPLKYLAPWEQRAAEVYITLARQPEFTDRRGRVYMDDFTRQVAGEFAVAAGAMRARLTKVLRNPAWVAYKELLLRQGRDLALTRLKAEAGAVTTDYLWARTAAKEAGDYKATHVAAADHLDRIGASEKPPSSVVQIATVNLRSRNFTEDNLLAPSPELIGEAEPAPDADA